MNAYRTAPVISELTRLQEREGWLPEAELREIAQRLGVPLHHVESVSTFYTHFRRTRPKPIVVERCRDLSCMMAGGEAARHAIDAAIANRDDVEIHEVSCLGRCDSAPAANVGHRTIRCADAETLVAELAAPGSKAVPTEVRAWPAADPYTGDAAPPLYATLKRAVEARNEATPPAERPAIAALKEAGLRGMGGAGFPTGLKWELVAKEAATPKYVICNADESEPGTFKDRVILHDLPHLVIEGMALAGLSVGASHGTVFIRHEYGPERERIEGAIDEARRLGALGDDVFGLGWSFDIDVFVSPGGYILGEETALLECMEDRRGEPRNKPPFPGQRGLFGQPTLINNVETFAHASAILGRGVPWWNDLGKGEHKGHKFISVSGDVAEPGVHLVPMGTTLGELLDACGGMRDGLPLEAIAPGGASSNFLGPDALDVALDFQTLADAGSMLGSGAAVFVARGHSLLDVGLSVTRFFRNESCGKCVPCRVGSEKAVAMLEGKDAVPTGTTEALRALEETMVQTSICGLGQVALGPLMSILDRFGDRIPGGSSNGSGDTTS